MPKEESFIDVLMKSKPVKKSRKKKGRGADDEEDGEEEVSSSAGLSLLPARQLLTQLRGIPIPWLSLQWAIGGLNIWPLHRFYGSAGQFGAGKSSFGYEVARWFLDCGGVVVIVDTEKRVSVPMITGFVGDEHLDSILIAQAGTVEEWQKVINDVFTKCEKAKDHPPMLILLDSLTAAETEGVVGMAKTEGYVPGRKFSEQAAAISSAFKIFVDRMDSNTCLMWTNHIKEAINAMIPGSKRKPGGSSQDYHASLDLWLTRTGDIKNGSGQNLGMKTQIRTNKSSFGVSRRQMDVEVRWGNPRAEDPVLRRTFWDWDGATTVLIEQQYKALDLDDILEMDVAVGRYSSPQVANGEKLNRSHFGRALRENAELYLALQERFGIYRVLPEQMTCPPLS